MENFVVSARKYRPVTFDTVVGQASITNTLKNAIRNQHLAQAFLFCGPRGVGKTTCARILAKTINCQNLSENFEACNTCESCISFNNSASFNIHELDAASNNSVDDIRNLVERVRVPPQVGKYKIYIIDEVHMLSSAAFNAFLKTLEEPPAYAKFILATTEKHKIIPTILSRCQIFDFKRITVDDIAKYLKYGIQLIKTSGKLVGNVKDSFGKQFNELKDLKRLYGQDIFPFIATDPRRPGMGLKIEENYVVSVRPFNTYDNPSRACCYWDIISSIYNRDFHDAKVCKMKVPVIN